MSGPTGMSAEWEMGSLNHGLDAGPERCGRGRTVAGAHDAEPGATKGDPHGVLRGLRIRQARLKKRMEELRKSNEELEASRDGYALLYDSAPVTERRQAEEALREQKNELQAVFDSVGDGIIVFDQNGLIQHLNRICPRYFPPRVLSGSCRDIFHPAHASHENCPVEQALRGERVETSVVSELEGHKTRYLDVTATPIEDAPGGKSRALVFFRDVTEKRVQELQLIQAEKMSGIGLLAAGVAHEINNPLTSVAGYAEALLRRFRDDASLGSDARLESFPRYLEVIVRESCQCKGIIDSLLNFSRKSEGILGEVDLNDILSEILELLRHQPGSGRIEIAADLDGELPRVQGDSSGLRQVFMNLLYNAFQSIGGSGRLEIATRRSDDGRAVRVRVGDTGCGIAPEAMDRIWDPFFTTKEAGKGLGLGLALTYNIVKRHGGEICVESKVGEGSLFTVRLPASARS